MNRMYPLFFILIGYTLQAQEVNNLPLKEIPAKYITFYYQAKSIFRKSFVVIDYGQIPSNVRTKNQLNSLAILKENNIDMEFNSEIDVLNFLAKNGFKLIESYQPIETEADDELNAYNRKFLLENMN
ncbi:hypothetical protein MG290_04780 [Flavobacterium sp. CBA20B-1]|uniref:hypothetical protein n=1 Tax=unclassified Flavobacterium TaxID=196869 RepID=UPI002224B422|nr:MULTISPECIES: hypothetical protein [unclassified Flavobacterium]WCM42995.1 hypothetical protein MG290_04780 [Flavobacterium sp. CBA20B-1]